MATIKPRVYVWRGEKLVAVLRDLAEAREQFPGEYESTATGLRCGDMLLQERRVAVQ